MLSRTQRRFLQDFSSFSKRHSRQYRYTIRKKVFRSLDDFHLVIKNNNLVGLDMHELKTKLDDLSVMLDSVEVHGRKRVSQNNLASANPFLTTNGGWGE